MYVPNHPKNKTIFKRPEISRTHRGRSETCRRGIAGHRATGMRGHGKHHLTSPGNTMLPDSGDPADAALHDTAWSEPAAFLSGDEAGQSKWQLIISKALIFIQGKSARAPHGPCTADVHGLRGWKRTIDSPAAVVFGAGRNA
jgi:hypothetical protein